MAERGPKYLRIYDELRQRISDGELGPGSRLASQTELAGEFGVTVMTLRQALARLEADGLIWSSRGRGTFVADHPVRMAIGNLTSFADQMRAQGHDLDTRVIGIDEEAAVGPEVRRALARPRGAMTEISRVRRVDGRPVVWQRTVLESALGARLDLDRLGSASLYDLIADEAGYRVARAAERLTAVLLDDEAVLILGGAVGDPALESVRISFSSDNTPFLYDRALLVGEAASVEADRTADRLALRYLVE